MVDGLVRVERLDGNTAWHIAKKGNTMGSLEQGNQEARDVAKTPWRVDLEMMKGRVKSVEYLHPHSIPHMTIAVVILDNGYALQGKSAPADAANFNKELGEKFAYEDALRQLWALEAYVMRDYLSQRIHIEDPAGRWHSNV